MPLTAVFALVDLAVAVWLLWTVPKQSRANKEAVVIRPSWTSGRIVKASRPCSSASAGGSGSSH